AWHRMVATRLMHMVAARLMPNLLDAMEPSGSPDEGAGKRGPHHFLWNCVALLHQSASKRRLQITIGIDRAPRPTQPDFTTWDCVGGSIAQAANTRLGLARERHRRSLPRLHWGGGEDATQVGRRYRKVSG